MVGVSMGAGRRPIPPSSWRHPGICRTAAVAVLVIVACAARARAAEVDWAAVESEAAALLSEAIRIDTTNPPGNETALAKFWAAKFDEAGLRARIFESEPGRGTVLVRLRGKKSGRPIVLLNHLDVVPAEAERWKHPPFAGDVADGYVHGRGAIDCKGMGVVEAMAMLVLKRTGAELSRDVLFLGTAGEETGGEAGAGWFTKNEWDELGNPEFVLNEGGAIGLREDGRRTYEVATVEKTPLWLRLSATGEGGHGSVPRGDSAVTKLIRALERIRTFSPEVKAVPEVERYYHALAQTYAPGAERERFLDLSATLRNPTEREAFLGVPRDAALVRNTISITVLKAGNKTNVIPPEASAELDVRLLPGEDPKAFVDELRKVVDDDGIELEVLLNFPPSSSPVDTALYRAIERVAQREGLPVIANVLRGFTDSHFFRERGVASYGFLPVVFTEEDEHTMHGIDERLSLENLREGTRRLVEILKELDRGENPESRIPNPEGGTRLAGAVPDSGF
jgi:acetylornithine deacetylase/succinyl-diaminopimelate desuccinylase-like protein